MNKKLLIIDDDPAVLRATARMLRDDFEVSSWNAPVDPVGQDFCLIDWQPGGPLAMGLCIGRGIPFAIYTADRDGTANGQTIPPGVQVIDKPATHDELVAAINEGIK